MLPKLLAERTDMFRYYSCKFRSGADPHEDQDKQGCARLALQKDFHIDNCYTIECSALGFLNSDRVTVPFTSEKLEEFGVCLANALSECVMIREEDQA